MKREPLRIGELTAKIPVIQGGMGVGVSLSGLAGAVAACGGVGVLSAAQIGYQNPLFEKNPLAANIKAIKEEIGKARAAARGGVLGINIMVATKSYARYVKASVEEGIDLIISGAGLPVSLPELVKGSNVKIAPIVSTAKAASVICRLWDRNDKRVPDLVIIEGPEAGGHLGFTKSQLKEYTPEVYREEIRKILAVIRQYREKYARPIPVAIAGGIYDRKDMDQALSLGADAVQMGTRFVTTYECDASMAYKKAYLDCGIEDILITDSPVGMPGRAVANKFLREKKKTECRCYQCLERCDPSKIPYCITKALISAVQGDVDEGLIFCGANAWRADKLEHVADILQELS